MPGIAPNPELDDSDVVHRLQAGDEATFARLVTEWTPALLRAAAPFVPSRQTAEEVVQDTWLAVIKGIDGFAGRSSLRTWVITILIRTAQHVGGREHRSMPFSAAWRDERAPAVAADRFHRSGTDVGTWLFPVPQWDIDPESSVQNAELRGVLDRCVATLPRRQQQVVMAHDVWGCEPAEICELLSITPAYQRVLLHRARSVLRAALADYLNGALR